MMEGGEELKKEIWCFEDRLERGGGHEEVVGIYTVQAVILCV